MLRAEILSHLLVFLDANLSGRKGGRVFDMTNSIC